MRKLLMMAVLLLAGSVAHAQTVCSATCRACGSAAVAGGEGVWGSITGTIGDQADLGSALAAKCSLGGCTMTGPILQAAGSAAAPSFSFSAETDMGCYRAGADQLTCSTGESGARGVLGLAASGATSLLSYNAGGTGTWIAVAGTAETVQFVTGGTARLTIGSSVGTGFPVANGLTATAARTITAGTGVAVADGNGVSGNPTISIDTATTPQFSSGTGDPPGTCSVGEKYLETDSQEACQCVATDTWQCDSGANTGNVSLAGTPDYITISGQQITRGSIDLSTDVTGDLPYANMVQASASSKLVGRGDGGAGDLQEITLGTNLSMSGTTLNAASSSSSFDPAVVEILEEFTNGSASTAGSIGEMGVEWIATATGTLSHPDSEASHPGIRRFNSHATNDNSGGLISFRGASGSHMLPSMESTEFLLDVLIKVGSNSTAITDTVTMVGLSNTADPTSASHAAWVRRDTDLGDTAFVFALCNASGAAGCNAAGDATNQKTVTSTITPSAGTWYRIRIRRVASGVGGNPTWYFRVNDETEKTFCSSGCDDTLETVPTATNGRFLVAYLTRTTTGVRSADVDYMYMKITGLSRY